MNEFEDLIDMLLIEQPDDTSETVVETFCETNDEGEVVCETITGDSVIETITELQSSSDQEQDEINQGFPTIFDSYFAPIYSAFSFVNALNPYDFIFQLETGADDGDVLLELDVDGSVEDGDLDFYDDENVEQLYFMELGDASDVMSTVENNGDIIFFLETDDDAIDPCEFGYFGPSNADVYLYSEADGEYDPYYYGNYQYDPYDNEIMYDQDEFEFGEVRRWQDQVLGELLFVVLALVLVKVVLFCKRSRSRPTSDRTTPLLTVAVEQQETADADTGSYIPPKATTVKKAVFAEKLGKEPYIVFI